MRRASQFGSQDSLHVDFGDLTVTAEARASARTVVADGVRRTGGTLADLGDALVMLGLVDDNGRPT